MPCKAAHDERRERERVSGDDEVLERERERTIYTHPNSSFINTFPSIYKTFSLIESLSLSLAASLLISSFRADARNDKTDSASTSCEGGEREGEKVSSTTIAYSGPPMVVQRRDVRFEREWGEREEREREEWEGFFLRCFCTCVPRKWGLHFTSHIHVSHIKSHDDCTSPRQTISRSSPDTLTHSPPSSPQTKTTDLVPTIRDTETNTQREREREREERRSWRKV